MANRRRMAPEVLRQFMAWVADARGATPGFQLDSKPGRTVARRLVPVAVLVPLLGTLVAAQEVDSTAGDGEENASNPLASVNNTDLKYQYFDLGSSDRNDFWIDGSYMLMPSLKLKYELHYWETNVTGSSERDFERLIIKPIYFPKTGQLGAWKYKLAVGLEWVLDFNHFNQGIGTGSDQLAPLVGLALSSPERGITVIPLVQQFVSYNGNDVDQTSFRFIGIKGLPSNMWGKGDLKVPVDWENDNEIPASFELQVGKMFNRNVGFFVEGLLGVGGDRPYDQGLGLGLRINY
jgi:hypothetical protein